MTVVDILAGYLDAPPGAAVAREHELHPSGCPQCQVYQGAAARVRYHGGRQSEREVIPWAW
jgi:hypothetical protein